MSNEEIAAKILECQRECAEALQANGANFTLNVTITENKNKINALRQQCTHMYADGTFAKQGNGRCKYCGAKIQ